ncbi:putative transcriptional coactivator Hfi1/Transcriptional adapter 1 [Helianthus annuus]|nr:putative transcriptional coactivator Hfi1/Transcriptional adapter 1 [Helianthus annuus]
MPSVRRFSRVDTFELKVQIEKRLGSQKAEKYFNLVIRYLNLKLGKSEFDKLCFGLIGRENVHLHNELIIAIVKNAALSKIPPQKRAKSDGPLPLKVPNGTHPVTDLQSLCAFPRSSRKVRTPNLRESKFKDRTVPFPQHLVTTKVQQQQQSATELFSLGSKPPLEVNSVEDGEEVEQDAISPGVYSRNPISAPFGITIHSQEKRKLCINGLDSAYCTETCHYSGHLPAANSLKNRLNHNLRVEGLDVSRDCVNLLNNGLDCFLKSVLKPSLELARSRSSQRWWQWWQWLWWQCSCGGGVAVVAVVVVVAVAVVAVVVVVVAAEWWWWQG